VWRGALLAGLLGAGLVLSRVALATGRGVAVAAVIAGLGHAALYGTLFVAFARSLRPGRAALVTTLAQRINPRFRAGMVPYTRAVTWVWTCFFAAQLAGSAMLLLFAPREWWLWWVSTLHGPMAIGLALAEFLVRRRRFPGEHTGFRETIRGVRATSWTTAASAGAGASSPAAGCPADSGNARPHPRTGESSAPGPAA